VLSVEGLTKRFGPTTALNGVDLTIHPGSIHALIGMNGSGKSTLVKALSGFHQPDEGRVVVNGREAGLEGEDSALAFVHQDLALVEELSVLENLALGRRLATRRGRVDWREERTRARRSLAPFDLQHVADVAIADLTKAEATIVAIARALERREQGCTVLVLDEPTSTLPASETEQLLGVMRDCARDGLGILFISHRLREVLSVSDDVTVLRNGEVSHAGRTGDATLEGLVSAMTGGARAALTADAASATASSSRAASTAEAVLEATGVTGGVLAGVDLRVAPGEIVGIAGLLGSGVEDLGRLLSGRERPTAGSILLKGEPVDRLSAREVGFIPADRGADGVLGGLTTRENASITHPARFLRSGRISRKVERAEMQRWFAEMTVKPADTEADILSLSGGNQQKVLLARTLFVGPQLLVAEEPTQGVDVYAKTQILGRLQAYAAEGLAVVLLSGEPEEISSVCDRMLVLSGGRIGAEFPAPFSTGDVLAAMHQEVS
jgi:ABC-type sugar transport system ATPase subunit